VVDFDAMLDFAEKGHIRVATDVFPEEPLPNSHRARRTPNLILCAHQAGALRAAIKQIGKLAVGDAELILRGLPPFLCKSAQPETVALLRSMPIAKS
jgi:phosphoglycerate dehydrogenase-like enzyme